MDYKKITAIGVSVVVIAGIAVFAVYKQKVVAPAKTPPVMQTQEIKPLPAGDEMALQKQLQEILAKGKEADCEMLADSRYQFACRDFFKVQKKK